MATIAPGLPTIIWSMQRTWWSRISWKWHSSHHVCISMKTSYCRYGMFSFLHTMLYLPLHAFLSCTSPFVLSLSFNALSLLQMIFAVMIDWQYRFSSSSTIPYRCWYDAGISSHQSEGGHCHSRPLGNSSKSFPSKSKWHVEINEWENTWLPLSLSL